MRYKSILIASLAPFSMLSSASTFQWNTITTGNWSTPSDWTADSGYPGQTTADTAVFSYSSSTTRITPNLDVAGVMLNEITFSATTSPYSITNSANSDTITFTNNGPTSPTITVSALTPNATNIIYAPISLNDAKKTRK